MRSRCWVRWVWLRRRDAPDSERDAPAAEQDAEHVAGARHPLVPFAGVGIGFELLHAAVGGGELVLGPVQLGFELVADLGDLLVGPVLGGPVAAGLEVVLGFADPGVELELGIAEHLDAGVPVQVVLQLRLDPRPEG